MNHHPRIGRLSNSHPDPRIDGDYYDFNLDEIREQLEVLGYRNVPRNKLIEFKRDLDCMLQEKMSECSSEVSEDTIEDRNNRDEFSFSKRCPSFGNKKQEGSGGGFKRKIVRRDHDGHSYHDESFSEVSDLHDVSDEDVTPRYYSDDADNSANDHIQYNAPGDDYDDDSMVRSRHARFMDDPVAGVLDYTREMKPMSARSMASNQSSSFGSWVRPQKTHPLPRKHDPVSRYHQYSDVWKIQKAPGEKTHRQLRWAVKEAMMIQDIPIKKPLSQAPPNDYIPPTDNHRTDLRWNIRQGLALHGMPSSFDFSAIPPASSQRRASFEY